MLDALTSADVFQDLPPSALARLAARARSRTFAAGQTLLRKGEINPALYVITRGRARVEWTHPDLAEPVVPRVLGPGEEFGALGVLDGEPRRETLAAVEETEAIELSARALAAVLFETPPPDPWLLSVLSKRIRGPDELKALVRVTGPPEGEPEGRAPPWRDRPGARDRAGPAP